MKLNVIKHNLVDNKGKREAEYDGMLVINKLSKI